MELGLVQTMVVQVEVRQLRVVLLPAQELQVKVIMAEQALALGPPMLAEAAEALARLVLLVHHSQTVAVVLSLTGMALRLNMLVAVVPVEQLTTTHLDLRG